MNAFTYLLIGYALGAVIGGGITLLACIIHQRQHRTWKRPFNTDYTP